MTDVLVNLIVHPLVREGEEEEEEEDNDNDNDNEEKEQDDRCVGQLDCSLAGAGLPMSRFSNSS